ncbi:MAG TPA: DUF4234 domain-containing protein [Verrucomicrobiae bacterium]|nr:DUF4234 domain-containing protein [Verrucomicrobiae bacterium]
MKHRSLLKVVLLSYVTLGVYQLVWLWQVRKGLTERLNDKKAIPSLVIALSILGVLTVITLVIFFSALSSMSTYYDSGQSSDASLIWLILLIFIVVPIGALYWSYRFARALHMVVGGIPPLLNLILLSFLSGNGFGPIWMLIAQNDINKFLDKENAAPTPTTAPTFLPPPPPPPIPPYQPGPTIPPAPPA